MIPPRSTHEPLLNWKKISQDLQEAFDKALDNEPVHLSVKLITIWWTMSTVYKRTDRKFTEMPAIILYVCQKDILHRGCDDLFPEKICGFPVDVVEKARFSGDTCLKDVYTHYTLKQFDRIYTNL